MRRHRLTPLYLLALIGPASVLADEVPGPGPYSDGQLTATWSASDGTGGITGTLVLGGRSYPATGRGNGSEIRGTFDAGGTAFPFVETFDGDTATFTTGNKTYALRRSAGVKPGGIPTEAGPDTPGGTGTAATPGGHTWRVRKVTLTDSHSGNSPGDPGPPAVTMLVPVDWTATAFGNFTRPADCSFTPPRIVLFAHDQAGTEGVAILPFGPTIWSNNPQVVRSIQASNQQFGRMQTSSLLRPRRAQDALREFVRNVDLIKGVTGDPDHRPMVGARPVGDPVAYPAADRAVQQSVHDANAQLARAAAEVGAPAPTVSAQVARQRFTATVDGHPVEAWMALVLTTRAEPVANNQGTIYVQDAPLVSFTYAPAGQLDGSDRMLSAVLDTVQVLPAWQQMAQRYADKIQTIVETAERRINDINNQMVMDNVRTAQKIAGIRQDTANYAAGVRGQVAADRANAVDHGAQQFGLYAGDQTIYRDPSGDRIQVPSGYAHAWASTTGNTTDLILTDSPSYDPNGQVGSGSWAQLEEEK